MGKVFITGFLSTAVLIIAIGAQNAFVLRQGIKREHVLPVVLICSLSDVLLISIGIAGLGALIQQSPALILVARYGGAAFLALYGLYAARRALQEQRMELSAGPSHSLKAAILTCLGFTYLNPHCWLDTVVLLGSIANQQPSELRWVFGAGAATASFAWFFALGYGARLLAPLITKPLTWRLLDGSIAIVMWVLAISLVVM